MGGAVRPYRTFRVLKGWYDRYYPARLRRIVNSPGETSVLHCAALSLHHPGRRSGDILKIINIVIPLLPDGISFGYPSPLYYALTSRHADQYCGGSPLVLPLKRPRRGCLRRAECDIRRGASEPPHSVPSSPRAFL